MISLSRPQGIADLTPREPVGVVLSVGVKGDRGFPIERDRFHLVSPYEVEGKRPLHSSFGAFNTAPPEARRLVRANIMHARKEDFLEINLKAHILTKEHPQRRPACVGNGRRAVRWMGGDKDNFQEIPCPGMLCPYAQQNGNKPAACKPWVRLLFRIRWKDGSPLPAMLCKFTSGSWNTAANALGMFSGVESAAKELRLPAFNWFGFPFTLLLVEKTSRAAKTRFPVVIFTPEIDIIDFCRNQKELLKQVGAPPPVARMEDQRKPDVEAIDVAEISVPAMKEQTVPVNDEPPPGDVDYGVPEGWVE